MLVNAFGLFLVNGISLGLFFFGVPYWTGKEMGELSSNGIYQRIFTACSNIGYQIYKVVELLNRRISKLFEIHPQSMWHSVINIVLYALAVALCNLSYNAVIEFGIHMEPDEFKFLADSSYARLSDILLIFSIVSNFMDVSSVSSAVIALFQSLFAVFYFLVVTILYFSIMHGLLEFKVKELHLLTRGDGERATKIRDFISEEIELDSWRSLPRKMKQNVYEFVDNFVCMRNFNVGRTFIFLYILIAMWSMIGACYGVIPDYSELLLDILDESELLNTLGSFVLSFILAKLTAKGCSVVYTHMPEATRNRIDSLSQRMAAESLRIKEVRYQWAVKMDGVLTVTSGLKMEWHPKGRYGGAFDKECRAQMPRRGEPKRPAVARTLFEAYAKHCDYYDGEYRWVFLKGVLVRFWAGAGHTIVLKETGEVQQIVLGSNEYGITEQDRATSSEL